MTMCTVKSQTELAPKTSFGKMIGCFSAVVGIIIFTLPIPIIVNSFANTYNNMLVTRELHLKRQRAEKMKATNDFLGLRRRRQTNALYDDPGTGGGGGDAGCSWKNRDNYAGNSNKKDNGSSTLSWPAGNNSSGLWWAAAAVASRPPPAAAEKTINERNHPVHL